MSIQDRIVDGEERGQTLGRVSGLVISWSPIRLTRKTEEKLYESFQPAGPDHAREGFMSKIGRKQSKELAALAAMNDDDINLSDLPELKAWSGAVVGKFYRPIKKPVTVRLDADVIAWLKSQGHGYQTRLNKYLRTAMLLSRTRRKRVG